MELHRVGRCEKCGIPMFDDKPGERKLCSFCSGNQKIHIHKRRKHKTPGEAILDAVRTRNSGGRGGCMKLSEQARKDLIEEINKLATARRLELLKGPMTDA
jgi:uncharacterized Zn finger protein (UPF0148 family)